MSDGFALLKEDHAAALGLFERYSSSQDEQVVRELCEALTLHAHLEEQALYPELRRLVDGGDDLADDAEQEHAALKVLIERIEIAPPPDLAEVVLEMRRLVDTHVSQEENTLFPEMLQSGVDAEQLGERLEAARSSTPTPGSP